MTANNITSEDLKILVLRSNIDTPKSAALVRSELLQVNWIYSVDIDLGDPENVLRLECHPNTPSELIEVLLAEFGFNGAELSYEVFNGSDITAVPSFETNANVSSK